MLRDKWNDPKYRAAKIARANAYAEFCRVAAANPHLFGQTAFWDYYNTTTAAAKAAFYAADDAFRTETGRINSLVMA